MKRITVKDLAKELNVSLGTINKVLNNKIGVGDETRKKVLQTAERMGYQMNRVAQSLARNIINIGIIIPVVWPEYYGYLKIGLDHELERLRDYNIIGKYYTVSGLHSLNDTVEALKACSRDKMDAVVICPAYESNFIEYIDKLYKQGIPVVTLGSDLSNCQRMSCVRVDSYKSGRLAAEFMKLIVKDGKPMAIFVGNKDINDHKEKISGFTEEAGDSSSSKIGVFETQDEPDLAYYLTGKVLRDSPDLGGIYVATGNSIGVCKFCVDNKIKNLRIIGTDIYEDMIQFVHNNVMQMVIFQDPVSQGKIAIKVIYDSLVNKICPDENILVTPQIVIKNNVDYYRILLKNGYKRF